MQVNDPGEVHPIKSPLYSWPHTSDGSHSALPSTSIMFPWYVYFPTVLVFYCCVTHYQKPNGLRHPCIISQSVGQKFWWAQLVLWSGSHKAKIKVLAGLAVIRRLGARFHFQAHVGCYQSPVPYGYGCEVPVSLLAAGWALLSAPRGCPQSFSRGQWWHVESPLCFKSLSSSSATSQRKFSAFKDSRDFIGLPGQYSSFKINCAI